jgi:hypothetical protein
LNGVIDYLEGMQNPKYINFRKSRQDQQVSIYMPADIIEWGESGKLFRSATVEVEISTDKTPNLDTVSDLHIEKREVFLRVVVLGQKSLFQLTLPYKDLFYIYNDGDYELLIYKRYIIHKPLLPDKDAYKIKANTPCKGCCDCMIITTNVIPNPAMSLFAVKDWKQLMVSVPGYPLLRWPTLTR